MARDLIQMHRGNQADLPDLAIGEFGYCLDTKKLYIGNTSANDLINPDFPPTRGWLYGAEIAWFGDSQAVTGAQPPAQIGAKLGATMYNYARGGATVTGTMGNTLYQQTANAPASNTVKLVVIQCGTNDYSLGYYPEKVLNTPAEGSFTAGINGCIINLRQKFPNASITWILPFKRSAAPDTRNYPLALINGAIYRSSRLCNFSVIDLYNTAPNLNPRVGSITPSEYMPDGLHTSDAYESAYIVDLLAEMLTARAAHQIYNKISLAEVITSSYNVGNMQSSLTSEGDVVLNFQVSGLAGLTGTITIATINLPYARPNSVTIGNELMVNVGGAIAVVNPNGTITVTHDTAVSSCYVTFAYNAFTDGAVVNG